MAQSEHLAVKNIFKLTHWVQASLSDLETPKNDLLNLAEDVLRLASIAIDEAPFLNRTELNEGLMVKLGILRPALVCAWSNEGRNRMGFKLGLDTGKTPICLQDRYNTGFVLWHNSPFWQTWHPCSDEFYHVHPRGKDSEQEKIRRLVLEVFIYAKDRLQKQLNTFAEVTYENDFVLKQGPDGPVLHSFFVEEKIKNNAVLKAIEGARRLWIMIEQQSQAVRVMEEILNDPALLDRPEEIEALSQKHDFKATPLRLQQLEWLKEPILKDLWEIAFTGRREQRRRGEKIELNELPGKTPVDAALLYAQKAGLDLAVIDNATEIIQQSFTDWVVSRQLAAKLLLKKGAAPFSK